LRLLQHRPSLVYRACHTHSRGEPCDVS
jgi:hypothetical protein